MSIRMDETVSQMKLTVLADQSTFELQRFRCKAPFDDRYCLEILRRALVEQTDEAWSVLEQCFSETIRRWIYSHPSRDVALLRDSEENYIAQTFTRFWYAVRDQHLEFTSLYAALSYLQRTAQKAPFFHKTGMNGRSFRAGWDGDAPGSRLVAEECVQGWRSFAVPLSRGKRSERHATATSWSDRKKTAQKE